MQKQSSNKLGGGIEYFYEEEKDFIYKKNIDDKIKIVSDPMYDKDEVLKEQQSQMNKSLEEDQKGYLIHTKLPCLQIVPEGNKQSIYAIPNKKK